MSEVLHVSHAETKRNVEPRRAAGHGMGTKDMLGCERIFLVVSEIQVTGNESGIGHESWYLDSKCNLGKSKKLPCIRQLSPRYEPRSKPWCPLGSRVLRNRPFTFVTRCHVEFPENKKLCFSTSKLVLKFFTARLDGKMFCFYAK